MLVTTNVPLVEPVAGLASGGFVHLVPTVRALQIGAFGESASVNSCGRAANPVNTFGPQNMFLAIASDHVRRHGAGGKKKCGCDRDQNLHGCTLAPGARREQEQCRPQ